MIKRIFFLFLLFMSASALAVSMAERRALNAPRGFDDNMPQLVQYLTDNMSDTTDKAEAIAVWIASHIAYDHDTFDAQTQQWVRKISREEQSAKQVLKDKIGVCSGFADLYEKMLHLAGIRSEKITGYVVEGASSKMNAKTILKKKSTVV